jgi:multiple antibiotic resistance protein
MCTSVSLVRDVAPLHASRFQSPPTFRFGSWRGVCDHNHCGALRGDGILALPPVFLGATEGLDEGAKRKVAYQTTIAVGLTMLVSYFLGSYILSLFKIDMNAFEVAGALVVANMAWGMIMARPSPLMDTHGKNPAVIPMAIPKTAGLGAIATVITLGATHTTAAMVGSLLAVAIVTLLALAFMLGSGRIKRTLGESGLSIVSRVFGLLLLSIAITSIMASLLVYLPGWAGT